jgi:hypothetical protein
MFPQWHIGQALWDVIIFISQMFCTAFCDDYGENLAETFVSNGGVA